MKDMQLNRMWLAMVVGLLAVTSNSWLLHPEHHASNYEAPWIYPGNEP